MPWIWLDKNKYPEYQKNTFNTLSDCSNKDLEEFRYCVADFEKYLKYDKKIKSFQFSVSADNCYMLFVNYDFIGIGPALPGGDFLCTGKVPKHYSDRYELDFSSKETFKIDICAKVRLQPEMCCDYSRGHGGFYLSGTVTFEDGTFEKIETDSTWFAFADKCYNGFGSYDARLKERKSCFYICTCL